MTRYEYKTIPAPARPKRFKGVKGRENLFARTVEDAIAENAKDGWEYYRAESLPCDERAGFFGGRRTVFHSLLVFRRALPGAAAVAAVAAGEPAVMAAGRVAASSMRVADEPREAESIFAPADDDTPRVGPAER